MPTNVQTSVDSFYHGLKVMASTHRREPAQMSQPREDQMDNTTIACNGDGPSAIAEKIAQAYRDHSATIRGIATRSTRDPELAADITQEAFLRLVVEAHNGRFPDNVGGWLYRTSANLIVSRARHAAVARRLAPRLVRTDGPAEPDAVVVLTEDRRELNCALSTLSPVDRVALVMAAHGASSEEMIYADRCD